MNSEVGVEREIERQEESNKKQKHRIRKLEAKAVQNVNLYFIFQAVILVSTSSASCRNSWIPITLSLVAAITNFLSFTADVSKILASREELDQNSSDLTFMKLHRVRREEMNRVAPGAAVDQGGIRPDPGSSKNRKRRLVGWLCVGLFGGCSGIVMYGCHRILCHAHAGAGGENKCVKLC